MLGNGAYGKVRLYRDRNYKELLFAIKTLKKEVSFVIETIKEQYSNISAHTELIAVADQNNKC